MQLSVKDVSKFLNISERTLYRWIKQQSIPVYRIQDQYRFNRVEILDWAAAQKINVSQDIFRDDKDEKATALSLAETLRKGGIYYRVEGKDKKSLLRCAVNLLNLPADINREDLLSAMFFREELGSTGVGEGIAIPHTRYPVVTHIADIIVSICFAEEPVDFGSIDGKAVHCLFTLISPTVRVHLQMLSRIAFVLKDSGVKQAVVQQASRETILSEIERVERGLRGAGTGS